MLLEAGVVVDFVVVDTVVVNVIVLALVDVADHIIFSCIQ